MRRLVVVATSGNHTGPSYSRERLSIFPSVSTECVNISQRAKPPHEWKLGDSGYRIHAPDSPPWLTGTRRDLLTRYQLLCYATDEAVSRYGPALGNRKDCPNMALPFVIHRCARSSKDLLHWLKWPSSCQPSPFFRSGRSGRRSR